MNIKDNTKNYLFRAFIVTNIFVFLFLNRTEFVYADLGPNLITNSSLEIGTTVPIGWNAISGVIGNKTKFTYPVVGFDGTKAARIDVTRYRKGDIFWMPPNTPVTALKQYRFDAYSRSNIPTVFIATYLDKNGSIISYATFNSVSPSNSWQSFTTTITIPANVTQVRIQNVIRTIGFVEVDAFSLQEVIPSIPPPPLPSPPPSPTTGEWTEGMVTLSFDDSWISQYTAVLPILESVGIKATFYITTEPILGGWSDFMTPAQVKDISQKDHEIGDHTITHPHLIELSQTQINKEIIDSKNYLETLTGKSVTTMAYPYGEFNSIVQNLVKSAGYLTARGVDEENLNTATTNRYNLQSSCILKSTPFETIKKAIDNAKANKQWYILCIHEVKTVGDEYSITLAQFQEIINYIKQIGIKTVTVGEGTKLMTP